MINLDPTKILLTDAVTQIGDIQASEVSDLGGPNDKYKGEASRQLNRLADTLERAAAETRAAYWSARGYQDPLLEEAQ